MKKLLLAAAALTALLTSCNEALEKPKRSVFDPRNEIVCNIDQMPLAVTKTGLDSMDYFQIWSEGDEISVLDKKGNNIRFSLSGFHKDSPAFGIFTGEQEVNVADALYAVYPYSEDCGVSDGRVMVKYPASVVFSEETGCAMGNNVMVAWNENEVFRFLNACALVKLELTGSVLVRQIVISRKDGGDIAGTGIVDTGLPTSEIVVEDVQGSKTVTIDFPGDGKQLTKEPASFVIGLAPVIENGIIVKLITSDGDEVENEYEIKDSKQTSCINTITLFASREVKAPTVYIDGKMLNPSIKKLAQGKNCVDGTADKLVTKIVFKTGVDLSTIVDGVDVSKVQDGRVLATYENGVATVSTDGARYFADLSYMFRQFNALETIEGFSNIFSTNTDSLNYAFAECKALKAVDLSNCDFSKVTSIAHAFENTAALASLDVTALAVAKPVSVASAFKGCGASEIIGAGAICTDDCTDMSYMFSEAAVEALDLSGYNTSYVTDMSYMFNGTAALESLNIDGFDTGKVEDMSYMFNKTGLSGTLVLPFNTASLKKMDYMFYDAKSITAVDFSSFVSRADQKAPTLNYIFRMTGTDYSLASVIFGKGFTSLNGSNQRFIFPAYNAAMPVITLTCSLEFASGILGSCTNRYFECATLIKNGKLIMKNLKGNPYTYTDAKGNPITTDKVAYNSLVVDPDAE